MIQASKRNALARAKAAAAQRKQKQKHDDNVGAKNDDGFHSPRPVPCPSQKGPCDAICSVGEQQTAVAAGSGFATTAGGPGLLRTPAAVDVRACATASSEPVLRQSQSEKSAVAAKQKKLLLSPSLPSSLTTVSASCADAGVGAGASAGASAGAGAGASADAKPQKQKCNLRGKEPQKRNQSAQAPSKQPPPANDDTPTSAQVQQLQQQWGGIEFLLRKPITDPAGVDHLVRCAKQSSKFLEELEAEAKELSVLKGGKYTH
jgi:hypothetical protein